MAKKNQWDLASENENTSETNYLEPYDKWEENFIFWLTSYLYTKCEEQSKRFVTDSSLIEVLKIQNKIKESKDIEEISDYVNELSKHKFKSIKAYYNNVAPLFYYMIEREAYSIKNITTKLLVDYFSVTKEKEELQKKKAKSKNYLAIKEKLDRQKPIKKIYELSNASKMNRLTIFINFIKYIEDNNADNNSDNEDTRELGFLFDISRNAILKQIKKEKRILTVLTPTEGFQKFFNAIEQVVYQENVRERNILMIKILMYLGIRVSELIYLKKEDISIEKDIVKFNIIGKGNKQRILYVTHSHIKKHMQKYEKIRVESPDNFYFTTSSGKQINDRYISTIISNTLKITGIEVDKKSSPHMLRHSVATYLKHNLKMDNVSISKWLGHEDIRTTMIYLHYTEQEIIDMAKNFKKIK